MKTGVRIVLLLVVAGLLAGGRALLPEPAEAEDPFQVDPAAVRDMGEVLWVDGRSREAYEKGHYKDALHLDPGGTDYEEGLTRVLMVWDPAVPVVVYCDDAGCGASRELAKRLRTELGVESIYWLEGGWETLREEEGR